MKQVLTILLGLVLTAASGAGCGNDNSCSHNSDCAQNAAGKSCAYRQSWCESGTCQAQCPQLCTTDISDVNSCAQGICTDNGQTLPIGPLCTVVPISCSVASDCPIYRPRDSAGAQHDWTCNQGGCAYEGLTYIKGQP